jgi:hypothetical protein
MTGMERHRAAGSGRKIAAEIAAVGTAAQPGDSDSAVISDADVVVRFVREAVAREHAHTA